MFIDMYCPDLTVRLVWWTLWRKWAVYYTYIVGPGTYVITDRVTKPYKSRRIAYQRRRTFKSLIERGILDLRRTEI